MRDDSRNDRGSEGKGEVSPSSLIPHPSSLGRWLQAAALVLGLVLLGAAGDGMAAFTRAPALPGQNESAGAEGRRLLAQYLWLKSESVIHSGVEEREATPEEQVARA